MDSDKKREPASASDVIQETAGDFGRWQLGICLLLSMTRIPASWHQIGIVFLAPPTAYTCVDSIGVTEPGAWSGDPCVTHAHNETREDLNGTSAGVNCASWRYDRSVFAETIITEWDLVCDREQLATLAQSSFMLGNVCGDVLFGIAADMFGRKRPLLAAVVLLVASGTAAAFVPWFEAFLVLRFVTALAVGGTMVTSFVICLEGVGGKWRMIVATLYHVPYGAGYSFMALVAFLVRDWRTFQLAISIPCVVLLGYCWLVPESPRWLVAAGRYDRATHVLEEAAKCNNLQQPNSEDLVDRLKEMNGAAANAKKATTRDLLRTRHLRTRTLCMCYNWFVGGFSFFGTAQLIGRIGGDIFVNVAVAGLLMTPGKFVCLLTLDRYGRRATLIGALLLAGMGSILVAAVPQGGPEWLKTVFALCGIMGLSVSVPTVYLYTIELFPTVLRNNGLGFTAMCGRIGSAVAPVAVALSGVSVYLPPLCFGLVPLLGVAISWPLPETAHARLPHSIEDVENCDKASETNYSGAENRGYVQSEATTQL